MTTETTNYELVCYTPNGREIRKNLSTGKFEVQPRRDNYWIACDTEEEAFRAFDPRWDGYNHDTIQF